VGIIKLHAGVDLPGDLPTSDMGAKEDLPGVLSGQRFAPRDKPERVYE